MYERVISLAKSNVLHPLEQYISRLSVVTKLNKNSAGVETSASTRLN